MAKSVFGRLRIILALNRALYELFLHFPFLCLKYAFRAFRPHPSFSYKASLFSARTKALLDLLYVGRIVPPLELKPGNEAGQFQVVKPAQTLKGVAAATEIKPTTVFGVWYPSIPPAGYKGSTVLHFHGGAYISLSARKDSSGWGGGMLAKHVADYAFLLEYRLAGRDDGAFPAQLQDAIAAYEHLLQLGIEPGRIVVSGDSAGGHLAISLIRYMVDNPGALPEPRAALLWSPAVDWASPSDSRNTYANKQYEIDLIPAEWLAWGSSEFIKGINPHEPSLEPYIIPINSPFKTQVPLWIQVCGLELLHDAAVEFGTKMEAVGNSVTVNTAPLALHDLFFGDITGFMPEATIAFEDAQKWLKGLSGSG